MQKCLGELANITYICAMQEYIDGFKNFDSQSLFLTNIKSHGSES